MLTGTVAAADASAEIGYAAQLRGGPGFSAVGGWVELSGIDPTQSLGVDVGDIYSETFDAPGSEVSTGFITGLAGGAEVSIRQPANGHKTDVVLTLAAPAIDAAGGQVFGTVPAGTVGEVVTDGSCGRVRETHPAIAPGAFEFAYPDFDPGVFQTIIVTDGANNTTALTSAAAGETPCFQVNSSSAPRSFDVAATHLTGTTLDTSRLVLMRDSQVLLDALGDGAGVGGAPSAVPQPGDELALYTPAGVLDPTYTATLPEIDPSYDPLTDLVRIDAPAASLLRAEPAGEVNFRERHDAGAGETQLDFGEPENGFPALALSGVSGVAVDFANAGHTLEYVVNAARIDPPASPPGPVSGLGAPAQPTAKPKFKVTAPSVVRVSSLVRKRSAGLKLKLVCSGRWTYNLALAFPASRAGRAVKLATSSGRGVCKSRSIRLAFTTRGTNTLKVLAHPRRATLTIRATGPDGHTARSAKSVTIKR